MIVLLLAHRALQGEHDLVQQKRGVALVRAGLHSGQIFTMHTVFRSFTVVAKLGVRWTSRLDWTWPSRNRLELGNNNSPEVELRLQGVKDLDVGQESGTFRL